jgi:DNA-binding CsgD family transcriptional regulator
LSGPGQRTSPAAGPGGRLRGRRSERGVLDRLAAAVRDGQSRVLVLYGEPGAGKTVLLDYLAGRAAGTRVVRTAGVQSEMELAFAGLHQLCAPMLDRLGQLPEPQQEALRTAFGLSSGPSPAGPGDGAAGSGPPAPDRFLVSLAVLSLLSEVAAEQPLLCVIDDQQWLDRASAQVFGFVARRLAAEPVGLVFGTRVPGAELAGLPELPVAGLRDDDARALLGSALPGPLDTRVRDQIVAEARGNPLALTELPRGLTPAQLAGGFGLPGAVSLPERIEESFRRQLDALPAPTRQLLMLAAADPSGDPALVWRAAGRLGIPFQAGTPAAEAGLAEFGARVRFRHPLLRSATYRSATVEDRQALHLVLAEATDPAADPDRRAWHRAQAAPGPDEEVAAELERSAGRALARGGLAAAAAFLERAVRLTADPAHRVDRTLAAAQVSLRAGEFAEALALLTAAEGQGAGPLDELASARVDLLRGQAVFASGLGGDAPSLLLKAAKRLEPLDPGLARDTYLYAWRAASFAGRLAGAGDMLEVSRAARALPPADPPRPADLVLDGLSLLVTEGPAAAGTALRQAVSAYIAADSSGTQDLGWGWMAASVLWDDDSGRALVARQAERARAVGALERLPVDLVALAMSAAWRGDFADAVALIAETDAICQVTGSQIAPYPSLLLTALRGDRAGLASLTEAAHAEAEAGGQGAAAAYAYWVTAILHNGLRQYPEALAAAEQAREEGHLYVSMWVLPELIEAAVRSGRPEVASAGLDRLAETAQAGQADLGLGLEARCRALLSPGPAAEGWYAEAIERLDRSRFRPELARAHLLYGEWLRRENRRADAREQLRTAYELLSAIGAAAFAERAQRELAATGETVRKRTPQTRAELTAQEASIARLAVDGRTNPEIGAQLFLSARTVEWHLRKVFAKLGISSRRELGAALAPSTH